MASGGSQRGAEAQSSPFEGQDPVHSHIGELGSGASQSGLRRLRPQPTFSGFMGGLQRVPGPRVKRRQKRGRALGPLSCSLICSRPSNAAPRPACVLRVVVSIPSPLPLSICFAYVVSYHTELYLFAVVRWINLFLFGF